MANEDILEPGFDSPLRKSALFPATFNLVATIVGGGVLSLPLAFSKTGIVLGTILMVIAAVITDATLYMLCLSARCTGTSSYGEVAHVSLGRRAEYAVAGLLSVFLLFVVVAYMVLIRDIWEPIFAYIVDWDSNVVLLVLVLAMSPFLVQNTLHSLRYNCYAGFLSISLLCYALCDLALQTDIDNVLLVTSNFSDILFAFPIITLSFLSHFNILPIQCALIRPTRQRIQLVVHCAVGSCFLLMYLFGLAGYLCFQSDTHGNILLNLQSTTFTTVLGRIGCGVTILLAMPMMVLPCRRNLLELLECWIETMRQRNISASPGEEVPLLHGNAYRRSHTLDVRVHVAQNPYYHYGSTAIIVFGCYLGAVTAPGVAIVWSLCGSFMAFLIAFILPSLSFLRIQRHQLSPPSSWTNFAWCLLGASMIAAVACTTQTTYLLLDPHSKAK